MPVRLRRGDGWTVEVSSGVSEDLLELPLGPLPIRNGRVAVPLQAHGFAAVRLIP
jgi:hypothetical protein